MGAFLRKQSTAFLTLYFSYWTVICPQGNKLNERFFNTNKFIVNKRLWLKNCLNLISQIWRSSTSALKCWLGFIGCSSLFTADLKCVLYYWFVQVPYVFTNGRVGCTKCNLIVFSAVGRQTYFYLFGDTYFCLGCFL